MGDANGENSFHFGSDDAELPDSLPPDEEKQERKSASTVLVDIAEELYAFGVSDAGETYGVPRTGAKVLRMLRGGKTSLRGQLSREYFRRTRRAAAQQSLADALLVIEGIAQDSEEQPLHIRVAQHDDALWLDLGDPTGRAVRVDGAGWKTQDSAPMLFKRTALGAALPDPVHGGDLADLWKWLNVVKEDQPLVAAWLVAALYEDIPHPILSISGEQGTGKSTAEKVLVSLLDPSPVPLRKPPRDAESWVTAAAGSWLVGLDNLSVVPDWLSDSLCRAVTGDGDVRRKLYTDGDMHVFAFRRCLILNGIDLGAVRGDLADRLLPIGLLPIPEKGRLTETELWPQWEQVHPQILGAVLNLAASVASVLPSVRLETKPRMADYAHLLAAVDHVLGTKGLTRYLEKQGELATDSLTGDVFISAVADALISKPDRTFSGTAADLLAEVAIADDKRIPKDWPANARTVTQRLRRQAPVMRKAGWTVEDDGGSNKRNSIRWTITHPEMAGKPDSPNSPHSPAGANGESASQASHEYGQSQDDEPSDRILVNGHHRERQPCECCGDLMDVLGDGEPCHPNCDPVGARS